MKFDSAKLSPHLHLTKRPTTSGGSRNSYFFKNNLPVNLKYKKLLIKLKYNAGRNNTGRVVIRTKKSTIKNYTVPKLNYAFRYRNLGFFASFILIPKSHKLVSLLMLSSGCITFVPSTTDHQLFVLTRLKSISNQNYDFGPNYAILSQFLGFKNDFFTIGLLPKNKPISLIESLPTKGITYVRSTGSSARILKMNSLTSTALIKLPSGVKKVLSTHSLASKGKVSLPENKKCKNNKAGFLKNFGKKSIVRGVAKNPVDHPHGGRAKAIRYQRTP